MASDCRTVSFRLRGMTSVATANGELRLPNTTPTVTSTRKRKKLVIMASPYLCRAVVGAAEPSRRPHLGNCALTTNTGHLLFGHPAYRTDADDDFPAMPPKNLVS